jgi:predicted negative regulator of RcsB-dependent stress response
MPRAIKRKIKSKETDTELEIRDALGDVKEAMKKRQKTILIYSVIGLCAILAFSVILFSQYSADQKARQLESRAYNLFYNRSPQKNIPELEQYRQALDLFQQAYRTQKSPRVLLYIANSQIELGQNEDAIQTLNTFIKKHSNAKDLLPIAYRKLAAIQAEKGENDPALKTLDTLYKTGPIFQDVALLESGKILDKEGKKSEADAKYKELIENFPGSPLLEEAKARVEEEEKS